MAQMTATAINDLPDSSFAYIEPGGKKDAEGKTAPRSLRHFPIHDEAHVRNALARLSQSEFEKEARPKVEAAARKFGIGEPAAGKALLPMKAEPLDEGRLADWIAGKRPRRLLAIPFYGPFTAGTFGYAEDGKGRDLDGEYFDDRTDIKPDWFTERPIDWHHSKDPSGLMNGALLGKATNLAQESDGWWVDTWMQAGEKRLRLVEELIEKGAPIRGSSWAYPNLIKRGKGGHIDVWPYFVQTLSTSPQNDNSRFATAKAALDLFDQSEIQLDGRIRDLLSGLDTLGGSLSDPSSLTGDDWAKAGRVISSKNEQLLQQAIDAIQSCLDEMRQGSGSKPENMT